MNNSNAGYIIQQPPSPEFILFGDSRKRTGKACDTCSSDGSFSISNHRHRKTKCDGKKPCTKCLHDGRFCSYSKRKRGQDKVLKRGYVDLLENRVEMLQRSLHELVDRISKGMDISSLMPKDGKISINKIIDMLCGEFVIHDQRRHSSQLITGTSSEKEQPILSNNVSETVLTNLSTNVPENVSESVSENLSDISEVSSTTTPLIPSTESPDPNDVEAFWDFSDGFEDAYANYHNISQSIYLPGISSNINTASITQTLDLMFDTQNQFPELSVGFSSQSKEEPRKLSMALDPNTAQSIYHNPSMQSVDFLPFQFVTNYNSSPVVACNNFNMAII